MPGSSKDNSIPFKTPFEHREAEYLEATSKLNQLNQDNLVWLATSLACRQTHLVSLYGKHDRQIYNQVSLKRNLLSTLVELGVRSLGSRLMLWRKGIRWPRSKKVFRRIFYTFHFHTKGWGGEKAYHDPVWGEVLEESKDEPTLVISNIFCGVKDYFLHLRKEKVVHDSLLFYPIDAFLPFWKLPILCLQSVFVAIKTPSSLVFKDADMREALKENIRASRWSGEILKNLALYHAYGNLLRKAEINELFYYWENHPWNIMLLKAKERWAPAAVSVAFQHGQLPAYLLNHFPTKTDGPCLPLPDRLMTSGDDPGSLLSNLGFFDEKSIRTGCALRHGYIFDLPRKSEPLPKQMRIGLATPCVLSSTLSCLEKVNLFLDGLSLEVKLRMYPLVSEAEVRKSMGKAINRYTFDRGSLGAFLNDIDVLIYSETSLGAFGLWVGVPVIYLDVGKGKAGDLLYQYESIKWSASSVEDLIRAWNEIEGLDDTELKGLREDWVQVVKNTFRPVSPEGVEAFLKS
jgi:hypothetical protein